LLLSIFGFPHKNKKNTKKKYSEEIQEIIGARKVCFNAEKWQNIGWGGSKNVKYWNLTIYRWLALLTKKIQFEEEKFEIICLWIQLNFI